MNSLKRGIVTTNDSANDRPPCRSWAKPWRMFGRAVLVGAAMVIATAANADEVQQYDGCGGDHVQYITGSVGGSTFTFLVNGVPFGSFNYEIYYRTAASASWSFLNSSSSSVGWDPSWTYSGIYPGYQFKIITYNGGWTVKDVHIWCVKNVTCTTSSKSVGAESGSFAIGGEANTPYSISDDASWLSVTPSSGSANVNGVSWVSTVSYTANSSTSSRSATITIAGGSVTRSVTVTQAGAPHSLSVSSTSLTLPQGGGSAIVTVTANVAWSFANPVLDWLTIIYSDNRLLVSATLNNSTATRSSYIDVFDTDYCQTKRINVTQAGLTPYMTVTPTSVPVPQGGGTVSFSISANVSWSVTDDASWLTVSPPSGSNNGTVTVNATSANTGTSARSATVTVTGGGITRTVTVTQPGDNPPYFTITTVSNPSAGGSTSGGGSKQSGSSCTVTASAYSGYTFANWTEGGTVVSTSASYAFTVTGNRSLTANFTVIPPNYFAITTSSSPSAGGSTSGGGSKQSGSSCTVTASAYSGYTFANWTEGGTVVSWSASYGFTVTGNRTLVANFLPSLLVSWDAGYQDIGGGWRRLVWFGDFVPMGGDGWIWHNKHGFFYVPANATPQGIWLYAPDMGWLWTSSTTYPFLYRNSDFAWLWYNGSTSPRWFRNMNTGRWESLVFLRWL